MTIPAVPRLILTVTPPCRFKMPTTYDAVVVVLLCSMPIVRASKMGFVVFVD